MKRVFVECALHRPSVIGPGVIGPFIVGPPLLGRALLDQPLLGRATRPVAPTFVWWTFRNCVLTKCQTKGATMPFLAPKYDLVDSEGLLGRFAKYRLMQTGVLEQHSGGCWERMGVLFLFPVPNGTLFITFRFVDSTLLLESETHFFLLSFSKDLTSGRETIVFGRWNYIVWGGKLYCLARETILFRARFVCFSKMKCIVF